MGFFYGECLVLVRGLGGGYRGCWEMGFLMKIIVFESRIL